MKKYKLYLLGMLLFPWITLPLIGKKDLKRFFPGSLLICLFVVGESHIAKKQVWWWFYKKLTQKTMGELPLVWGPFFIGTLWILKLTFGKPLRYFTANFLIDSFFVYVVLKWFKRFGYASLVRMNKINLLLIFTFKQLLLYQFQMGVEKLKYKIGKFSVENATGDQS